MIIELPIWPPTTNTYYRNVNGRMVMSAKGRQFLEDGLRHIAPLIKDHPTWTDRLGVNVMLFPPDRRKRDLDNYLKAVLDLMTKAKVWEDDSQIDILQVSREARIQKGRVTIEIWQRREKHWGIDSIKPLTGQ